MITTFDFSRRVRAQRGSALIVALIFMIAMGLSLASYLSLVNFNLRSSHRGLNSVAAINLAEMGIEEILWNLNAYSDTATRNLAFKNSSGIAWTLPGGSDEAYAEITSFKADSAASNKLRIWLANYTAPTSKVRVHASLKLGDNTTVEKWLQVQVATSGGLSSGPSHLGLVAEQSIRFAGNNASVDSWDSDPDGNSATADIKYSTNVRNDMGFVGSKSVQSDIVSAGNANIFGFVNSARNPQTDPNSSQYTPNIAYDPMWGVTIGPNGYIKADDTTVANYLTHNGQTYANIDARRVANDFNVSLPMPTAPTNTAIAISNVTNALTLPRGTDSASADGKYYYRISGINLQGNSSNQFNITSGNVIITMAGDINISGQATMNISTGAKVEIFASGDVSITGTGVSNGTRSGGNTHTGLTVQQPANLKIWGTSTSTKNYNISGNGALSAVVYAPTADVIINGNGETFGSITARTIELKGNAAFHYDESLGKMATGTTPNGSRFTITNWRELTDAAERRALF